MKYYLTSFTLAVSLITIFCHTGCSTNDEERKVMTAEEQVEWGKYLVNLGGCNDCHSPKKFTEMGPVVDSNLTLSGHPADFPLAPVDTAMIKPGNWYLAGPHLTAWVGPWGVSFSANITPDEPTGIGTWTDEIFINAMRTGKHMGTGRQILPPMPWFDIGKLKDDDLKAIFAYLKSLKPVNNKVPDPIPPHMIAQKIKIK